MGRGGHLCVPKTQIRTSRTRPRSPPFFNGSREAPGRPAWLEPPAHLDGRGGCGSIRSKADLMTAITAQSHANRRFPVPDK